MSYIRKIFLSEWWSRFKEKRSVHTPTYNPPTSSEPVDELGTEQQATQYTTNQQQLPASPHLPQTELPTDTQQPVSASIPQDTKAAKQFDYELEIFRVIKNIEPQYALTVSSFLGYSFGTLSPKAYPFERADIWQTIVVNAAKAACFPKERRHPSPHRPFPKLSHYWSTLERR